MTDIQDARFVIEQSKYMEFPQTVLHANLCIASCRMENRSIAAALRAFALARAEVVKNASLRATLIEMSTSKFPEVHLTRIKGCVSKMESAMRRELRALGGAV